jgi:hypothetical protein
VKYFIYTEVIIEAPLEKVWAQITDFVHYEQWNDFITNVKGRLELGSNLDIEIHPLGKKNQKYKVKIVKLQHQKELSWYGVFGIRGLINGNHALKISGTGSPAQTKLIHQEVFTGLLLPYVWESFILPRIKPGFYDFNLGLKKFLER